MTGTKILTKINKFPQWTKGVFLAVVLISTVLIFNFMSWEPLNNEIKALKGQYKTLEAKYLEQKRIADNLGEFKKKSKELEENLQLALRQLPKSKEIPTLLRDIYTEGRKSGVAFKTFQPQSEQKKKLYAALPIKLKLEGSYHEIAVFLDRIGKLSRIVNVDDIELSALSDKDGNQIPLTVNCTATTFRFLGT
jgi:type IV pilus assembly protein PilO